MKTNTDIILEILNKIAFLTNICDEKVAKIMIRNPSIEGKGFLKSQLLNEYPKLKQQLHFTEEQEKQVIEALRMKKIRSLSGVTPVTVLTKPFPCPGSCIYCPNDSAMPKSYLSSEPGAQRALANKFDPYMQVNNRLYAYKSIGHPTDKVELIVLGGTWSFYPKDYQMWYIYQCFKAMNDFNHQSLPKTKITRESKVSIKMLEKVQKINETANARCVGLVLETRPDFITHEEVIFLRRLGATKIQLGVQSLDNEVLKKNNRGHSVSSIKKAFKILRLAGFKIQVHWMPNLLGSNPLRDINDFKKLASDKNFIPDELKIYPCSLIGGTKLTKYYNEGIWKPYTEEELKSVLSKCLLLTPRFTRISRIIRDISSDDILVGNKKSNLRQDLEKELLNKGKKINEIRFREVREEKISLSNLKLKTTVYETSQTQEYFLEYVTKEDRVAGFLRLSLPKVKPFIKELEKSAMIREIHVYGQTLEIGSVSDKQAQHIGLGKRLIEKAKEISLTNKFKKLSVISSIGTKQYYSKNSFVEGDLYQYLFL